MLVGHEHRKQQREKKSAYALKNIKKTENPKILISIILFNS